MLENNFWMECCFKFTASKIKLLEHLYQPIPKSPMPVEDLYPLLKKIGYKKRRFRAVLKELKEDGFVEHLNGVIKPITNTEVIKNITKLLILHPFSGGNIKKPKGGLKDRKLRYYLPSVVGKDLSLLKTITKKYQELYGGRVNRQAVQKALDEKVGTVYERVIRNKGKKNKAVYYKLKP